MMIPAISLAGEPQLEDRSSPVRFIEGDGSLEVNLQVSFPAFPFPATFQWSRNAEVLQNDTRRSFGYPALNFTDVTQPDAGLYALIATNHFLEEVMPRRVLGTGSGQFTLDVLCEFA